MATSRYIDHDGRPLHVMDHGGRGKPWLLIHGLGGNVHNWGPLAARLVPERRVIAVDLPGFGLSPPGKHIGLDAHTRAAVAVLAEFDEPAVVVGNSMGGLVAEIVARQQPDRVSELVLFAPATPPPHTLTRPSDSRAFLRLAAQSLPVIGTAVTKRMTARMTPEQQVENTLDIVAADPAVFDPEFRRQAVEIARIRRSMPWAARAFAQSAASIRQTMLDREHFIDLVNAIQQPTLLIWGDRDRVVTPGNVRWLASLRPDWRTVELEGIGHVPMAEAPQTSLEIIDNWWETLARAPGGRGNSESPGL